ncbi:Ninja-family protein AFP1, partial [Cucurbita argyrosperma subsp. argyrosperma]
MGEANEAGSRGLERVPLQIKKYPTDLLQRFLCSDSREAKLGGFNEEDEEEAGEIELNLGLSLGGRFGVDKNSKLIRSSSVVGTIPLLRDDEGSIPAAVSYPALIRTASLPPETEEEWRKRKALQTLRRMEAKRRRFEKQRSKDGIGIEDERRGIDGLTVLNLREKRPCAGVSTVVPPFGLPTWAAAARHVGGTLDGGGGGGGGLPVVRQPASQCSAESQGGSSSGMSELDSKHIQGTSNYGEARSSSQEQGNPEAAGSVGSNKACENPSGSSKAETRNPSENRGRETGTTSMEDMPCVFTIGDGPGGRRVEGILYKYGKGEEVRIMCVCHGKFLSPAEFVKHAGGKNVAHPLRHIVVNPNSGPSL